MKKILVIVEGQGEVEAVPLLIRRILGEMLGEYDWQIETHRRGGLDHLRANGWRNFERFISAAFYEECPILWTIDCDDDCARNIAHQVTNIVTKIGARQPFGVACWVREFETMFLYDFESTRNALQLVGTHLPPENPEGIRGAKEWLTRRLPKGRIYKPTVDQAKVTSQVDLDVLHDQYRSFGHFFQTLQWLISQSTPGVYPISAP